MGKLIAIFGLVVIITTMMASNQLSLYASPTTEDDGWVEGDYEGSPEEQEEQAQDDWEDAGRPGEDDDDDDDDQDDKDPYENLPTPEEAGETGVVDCGNGVFVKPQKPCPQDEEEPILILCPDGQTQVEEDRVDEDCPETSQASATGLPLCDGTFQDCVTGDGFVCVAGSAAHECELPEPVSRELPDNDYLFNTRLPKCAPDPNGKCPDDFGTNEDGRCFVIHGECPDGYHTTEDDETGECNPNSECTGDGYVLVNDGQSCREKKTWCDDNPGADECKQKEKKWGECDVPFYMPCSSQLKKNNDNKDTTKVIQKTTVVQSAGSATTTNEADISNCKLDGSADGIQQKFNPVTYQACRLYTNADKAYYDGFVTGYMQVGNTKLICETVANSNVASSPAQTQTLTPHPTQAIQPAAVS